MARRRVWSINGDFIALHPTGVVRHAREVTLALDTLLAEAHPLTADLQLTLVAPRPPSDLGLKRIDVQVVPEFRKPRIPQFWVQAQLPRHAPGGLLSFCNLAPMHHPRHIVCIHDLQTVHTPESYGRLFRLAHRLILPQIGKTAKVITTVSGLSRDHLVAAGIAGAGRIAVTYSGADHAVTWDPARSALEIGTRPYLMCLGRNEKHKNVELMWKIAPHLDALGMDIYLPGDLDAETVQSFGAERPANIRCLGRISDDDLAKVYARAACYALPSRIEGFALTAIEAMHFGCPVIASSAPSMPESCDDAALYAHPHDPAAWVSAVQRIMSDQDLRHDLVARGTQRARAFTWRNVALAHLDLMARIDRGEPQAVRADAGDLRAQAAQ